MIANNLEPAFPTHPGSILKEELDHSNNASKNIRKITALL